MLNELQITRVITSELGLQVFQVSNTLELFNQGATVPFIARYRKERTGLLDEVQIRNIRDRFDYIKELEERRDAILKSIEEQGKLSEGLKAKIEACLVKQELEDLYLPYKPKRKTKGMAAKEKGLEPLAVELWLQGESIVPEKLAQKYINPELGISNIKEALEGAKYIISELIADDAEVRKFIREITLARGILTSRVKEDFREQKTKFNQYYDFKEPLKSIPSHRFLAIIRGENEEVLTAGLEAPAVEIDEYLLKKFLRNGSYAQAVFLTEVIGFAYRVYLSSSIEVELRSEIKEKSDIEAIKVFAENLRNLLLAPPAGSRAIMGIDPGLRTGCKIAVLDDTGKFLEYATVFPHGSARQRQEAGATLAALAQKYKMELAAIGNGTASRETDAFVREMIQGNQEVKLQPVVVSESGASVYSASDLAREEFPDLDVSVRGAISIARRLQDPLAELVKIDPKSIGVGQYQHDVNQPKLRQALHETVESCVNFVGVDLNTASYSLLAYVSGLSQAMAKNIVKYRDDNGAFKNRKTLLKVPRLGPKAFEQAAGFLRIRGGADPLDNSAVHPESYSIVKQMAQDIKVKVDQLVGNALFAEKIDLKKYMTDTVGLPTLTDILSELKKPGRDPRQKFELANFMDGVTAISHLKPGMMLEGVVTNVANFGAFIDIGVHQDGLVHISQLANKYVRDPKEVVKVGQKVKVKVLEVELERKRIALSMKEGNQDNPAH
ncbi:MAG: RNA-binding transcriptional accessory protein [Candidatus Edwardsbacteria bacterium RIFOXYD12_FULL_50_11]|uniref:RNA-binding transcriptional accessory protein n=1 Tax=Candidatus Edwardsbacteria bacterium GWF2_54_11 TaxID=1817851 RepID=A0A1F5RBT3_9BACT|nr:MAG: RNA-binding transcriptional accessory protein [Candidatus Edwardsbacteria bacterium RifOxyC12_full_54_24]OGF07393.1 MAG: RNA-binding transcriptional accessory protein [Candidatus Edwardsbacteria bacterium RifOxyA12_full_54_48]OGF09645.1 MAG: RNA-binding transcriptional accessory protein [Candidatus Edwardsbacteria bacterium GWE2_54_12]OGF11906.1 MAG: RNA-binding transcriptional accessory protein [Candidatus Edwardsbacteria bacterium GWF2_54_11]OGF18088.1 MAG: RNA-binding transcriptional